MSNERRPPEGEYVAQIGANRILKEFIGRQSLARTKIIDALDGGGFAVGDIRKEGKFYVVRVGIPSNLRSLGEFMGCEAGRLLSPARATAPPGEASRRKGL